LLAGIIVYYPAAVNAFPSRHNALESQFGPDFVSVQADLVMIAFLPGKIIA
jgi:hypothetical protein